MTCAERAAGGDGDALHALLLYDSEEGLRGHVLPYVREGLDRGEAVMAVVSPGAQRVLRAALGDDARRVRWQAGDVSYRRLGEMFEGFRRFLAEQRAAGVAMRLLAENDTVGTAERMAAYLRFEAMANEVYRPYGYRWACLYDTRSHSAETLRQVRPPAAAPPRWSRDPERGLHRAQQLCRAGRAAAVPAHGSPAGLRGDRSGPACGVPAPAAAMGRDAGR
jgi:MEDS: MEthanogen/methylotroph, DcmR Sensory domain